LKQSGNKKRIFNVFLLGSILVVIAIFMTQTINDSNTPQKTTMQRIRERGYILAGTDKNTLNYFIFRGEAMGYQLELLRSFARTTGLTVRLVASNDIPDLYRLLKNHAIDILALNIPVTRETKKLAGFTKPFGDTRMVLVQRKKGDRTGGDTVKYISSLSDFNNDTVVVHSDPFMTGLYEKFIYETDDKAILMEVDGVSDEELVRRVSNGTIRYFLCPENLAMVMKRSYENIEAGLVVARLYPYAWGLNYSTDSLMVRLDTWIDSIRKEKVLKRIYIDYFNNQKTVSYFKSNYSSINGSQISPYDREIRDLSRMIWWDWRLIASLMYEESNFITGQVSHRSASGLMQLVPGTAEQYGLDSTSGPGHQIAAGIKYLKWIDKQLPAEISDPRERINFILASYNVGIGKVLAIRSKAEKFGKDPNRWNGNVEYYLLKRSKSDPYGKGDSLNDFPVNYNTEGYVDEIISRYYHYRNLIPQ
jgi:membrane-bound lytic murein transglycosylase F